MTIVYSTREVFVDLGIERSLLAIDKGGNKVAIEVKTFATASPVTDLHRAIGQYMFYDVLLKETDPERIVYLAIDEAAYEGIFAEPIGELMVSRLAMRIVIFSTKTQGIVRWIN